jgi:hypothetical protein
MALKSLQDAVGDFLNMLVGGSCSDKASSMRDYMTTLMYAPIDKGHDEIEQAITDAAGKLGLQNDRFVLAALSHVQTERTRVHHADQHGFSRSASSTL